MSFLSVLRAIPWKQGIAIAQEVEPAVAFMPGGSLFAAIVNAAAAIEQFIPEEGQGSVKKPLATSLVMAKHPGADSTAVGNSMDLLIAALKALQKPAQ